MYCWPANKKIEMAFEANMTIDGENWPSSIKTLIFSFVKHYFEEKESKFVSIELKEGHKI